VLVRRLLSQTFMASFGVYAHVAVPVRRRRRLAVMAKPVIVVVDDKEASRRTLTEELESRYGGHYQIVSAASPDVALARLEELRADGSPAPLVLADQWMPGMTGTQFLARADHPDRGRRRLVVLEGLRQGRDDRTGGISIFHTASPAAPHLQRPDQVRAVRGSPAPCAARC